MIDALLIILSCIAIGVCVTKMRAKYLLHVAIHRRVDALIAEDEVRTQERAEQSNSNDRQQAKIHHLFAPLSR